MRELLTHTSGLVSGTFSGAANRKVVLKGQESLSDYLPRLAQTPLEFQPGTRWAYSAQAGFDVLLHIVEITSGMQADQFLKTRLFDPLGMKDTFYYPVENPRLAGRYDRQPDGTLRRNTSTPKLFERPLFRRRRRTGQHRRGLLPVRADAARRRPAQRQAVPVAARGGDDGVGDGVRHTAGPSAGRGLRPQHARREQSGRAQHRGVAGHIWLERRLRHALLDRSKGKSDRHPDGADAESGNPRRLRECRRVLRSWVPRRRVERTRASRRSLRSSWQPVAATASAQTADTVLVNGKIVTVDAKESVVEALAVRDGRIVATGASAAIRKLAGPSTRTIDLQGRTVVPGLIDSHLHAIRAALSFSHRSQLDRRQVDRGSAGAHPQGGADQAAGLVAHRRRRLERAAVRGETPSDAGRARSGGARQPGVRAARLRLGGADRRRACVR